MKGTDTMNEDLITVAVEVTTPLTAEKARAMAQSVVDKEAEQAFQTVLTKIEAFAEKGAFEALVRAPIQTVDPWVIRKEVAEKLQAYGFRVKSHSHGDSMLWEVSWR